MAGLLKFYEGGVTVADFRSLNAGELLALIEYRDQYVQAQKKASKR